MKVFSLDYSWCNLLPQAHNQSNLIFTKICCCLLLFTLLLLYNVFFSEGLDLVIVPGLGFTRQGHRLGRGKGYYDSFFENYRKKFGRFPVTVGLAFREQICNTLPTTEHDVQLDFVLFDECSGL